MVTTTLSSGGRADGGGGRDVSLSLFVGATPRFCRAKSRERRLKARERFFVSLSFANPKIRERRPLFFNAYMHQLINS